MDLRWHSFSGRYGATPEVNKNVFVVVAGKLGECNEKVSVDSQVT